MNPFKDYPHLFANGKFKCKVVLNDDTEHIVDYSGVNTASARGLQHENTYPYKITHLVARPISDMSDGEVLKVMPDEQYSGKWEMTIDERKQVLSDLCQSTDGKGVPIIYLLSIGVYPFDQNHFNDGTVLNINEVE